MGYSLTTLTRASFAFDGTVESVKPVNEGPDARFGRVQVAFAVHEWFRGGRGPRVTISLFPTGEWAVPDLRYGVGTRLLVSGANQRQGIPIGWSGCGGFTQPYTPSVAANWRSTLNR
ncbi:hypothetical protein GCM10009804_60760 [Kribbella hippodromi]|uniref:Uncharacterized protein n=1 Tax=Kribbella hippodromi TaxID=434347 RepID=A0ABP4Q5L9_9ACTN